MYLNSEKIEDVYDALYAFYHLTIIRIQEETKCQTIILIVFQKKSKLIYCLNQRNITFQL